MFKKVLIILRYSTKHAKFWLGVQFPLKEQLLVLHPGYSHFPELFRPG